MQSVFTTSAPAAIGPYSQAIRCGQMVFLSGQIGLVPETMALVSEDVSLQIIQVIENLQHVCVAAGGTLAHIVKLSVYLTDLNYFSLVNDSMSRYFNEPYPARVAIGVSALPRGAQVEMDGVMVLDNL
jgi:reactive intermediate/imine deaminase